MFWTRLQAARSLAKVYDRIAPDFARTREKPWPELEILFQKTPPQSRILDLGCGNGRLFPLFQRRQCRVTGVDISARLLDLARTSFPEGNFIKADLRELPFAAASFDEVWAVASLQHLCRRADQLKAFREIGRVLVPNGTLVMTFWNLWNLPKYAPEKRAATRRARFFPFFWKKQDFLIPWGTTEQIRYYYAFQVPEVEALARQAGFSLLECWGATKGRKTSLPSAENICLRFQKKPLTATPSE